MRALKTIIDYYMHPAGEFLYGSEIRRAMLEFNGGAPYDEEHLMDPQASSFFLDWFLFDFKFAGDTPPLYRFGQSNPLNLSEENINEFKELAERNAFDFFEVKALSKKSARGSVLAAFESVRDGKKYEVYVPPGGDMSIGDVAVCRIGRLYGEWCLLSLDPIAMANPSKRDRKRMQTGFPVFNARIAYHELVKPQAEAEAEANKMFAGMRTETLPDSTTLLSGGAPDKDDDCAVCRATHAADKNDHRLTFEELTAAFASANDEQKRKQAKKPAKKRGKRA